MAGPRFIAVNEAAAPACARMAQHWEARGPRGPAALDADNRFILIVARPDSAALAGIVAFFSSHDSVARDRCIAVSLDTSRAALQWLLAQGFGDVLEARDDLVPVIAARLERWSLIDAAIERPVVSANLIGDSPAWRGALRTIAESAMFSGAPVLLTGPTGTGKELLARLLHTLDTRPGKQELVTVDCTTLAPDLAGSELFGHERGAFTGAVSERDGAVALADGGTLFLDEVGELSLDHQARLLRVLQERTFRRIGGTSWRRSEFRLVCATNRDLAQEVAAGRFRADLFHRIAAINCRTPALADRREDIPALVRHMLMRSCGKTAPPVSSALLEYLSQRAFDGNVRELSQLIQSCLRRYPGAGLLSLAALPEEELRRDAPPADAACEDAPGSVWQESRVEDFVRCALRAQVGLKELSREVEAAAVRVALAESDSLTAAASRLGVTPRALHLRRAAERDSNAH